jgi:hypothetical protein
MDACIYMAISAGVFKSASGDVYNGEWLENKMNGKGGRGRRVYKYARRRVPYIYTIYMVPYIYAIYMEKTMKRNALHHHTVPAGFVRRAKEKRLKRRERERALLARYGAFFNRIFIWLSGSWR